MPASQTPDPTNPGPDRPGSGDPEEPSGSRRAADRDPRHPRRETAGTDDSGWNTFQPMSGWPDQPPAPGPQQPQQPQQAAREPYQRPTPPRPAPAPAPAPQPVQETAPAPEPVEVPPPATAAAVGEPGKVLPREQADKARNAKKKLHKKKSRKLRTVLISLVVLLALLAGAAGWYGYDLSRKSFPAMDGAQQLPGLTGSVEVVRDGNGIPQVYADTSEDLFRAQGYVQAQDRFYEMDVRRHMTAGRLSEMFGSGQVENDEFLRTLGWRRIAEKEVAMLSPEAQRYLQSYSDGVNAYLKGRPTKEISFEYPLLGVVNGDYKPEPWTPADSVAWMKAMAWDLRTNLQDEIDRALLSDKLTVNQIDQLYPPYPYERNVPIVPTGAVEKDPKAPNGEVFKPDAPQAAPPKSAQSALSQLSKDLESLPSLFSDRSSGVGSNSWVVSGKNTTTGKPLLANDPHLSASLPSVWYQMGLHCRTVGPQCSYDVSGFTFSGMPGVVIGHNQKISWGFTNLGADVTDLYLEKVSDTGYLKDGQMQPFEEVREETIKVAGGKDKKITVRSTRHGPILSESSDDLERVGKEAPIPDPSPQREDGFAVALRWTALDPGKTMDSLFQLNKAGNWTEFRAAVKGFEAPSQNLVYADVEGNIGYQAPGKIPVRRSGDGRWPVYGWDSKYDWEDSYIPFESLPYMLNPESGYIVTANNAVVSPGYPYLLTNDWGYGARSQRINDLIAQRLQNGGKIDPAFMETVQADDRNPVAELLVPYLLKIQVSDPWVREAQDLLKGWDFRNDADSKSAAYFNAVWRQLLMLGFGDKMPMSVRADNDCDTNNAGKQECGDRDDSSAQPDGGDRWFEVVRNLLNDAESPWWNISRDPGKITNLDGLLSKALTNARKELTVKLGEDTGSWSWGRLHKLELKNQTLGTAGPRPVKWLLNEGPYKLGGGEGAVNATGWNAAQGYEVTAVPSMRMVVDLSNFDASRWINLTGASGHVFHDNYTDQTELWRKGETLPWAFTRPAVDGAKKHTLTLNP